MTCHEFINVAESLTPAQLLLMQTEDEAMVSHGRECAACGRWLAAQGVLSSALQTLRLQTARREAGPKVEQAVLQAFRARGFGPAAAVAPERAASAAWKLSRFFEIGAYAAVAAALVVGVLLEARMWSDRQTTPVAVQAPAAAASPQANSVRDNVAGGNVVGEVKPTEVAQAPATKAKTQATKLNARQPQAGVEQAAAASPDRQGFVPLMFCDPLICSGDEQVIRMELPGNGAGSADGNGGQPVIADVVIGDDGLVRAMRIVN